MTTDQLEKLRDLESSIRAKEAELFARWRDVPYADEDQSWLLGDAVALMRARLETLRQILDILGVAHGGQA